MKIWEIDFFRRPAVISALAVLAFIAVYLLPLGNRPLLIPDEARYSQIPREMISSGNYFAPTFAGMPYYEKPSGGYYPEILAQKILGESNFTTRIPYVVAAALTLLLTYLLARRSRDDREHLPYFAVMILMTMGEFFVVSTVAVLDGLFSALLTGALASFYFAWDESRFAWRKICALVACGLFIGAAFIVKGFLAFALPGLAIVGFLLWMRDYKSFLTLPWIILGAAAAVIVPWGIATAQAAPDFWRYFVVVEHLERFLKNNSSQHPQPFFFFIPVLLVGALPYTLFIPELISGGKKLIKQPEPLTKFCVAAVVLPFVFLSLSRGKLVTYILPIFPPLAILIAGALLKAEPHRWTTWMLRIAAGVAVAAAILLVPVNQLVASLYAPGQGGLIAATVISLLAGGVLLWYAGKATALKPRLGLIAAATLVMMLAWQSGLPEIAARRKAPEAFLRSSFAAVPGDALKLCRNEYLGILSWVTGKDFVILGSRGEFRYGLEKTSGKKLMAMEDLTAVLKDEPTKPVAVYSRYKHRKTFQALPRFSRMLTNGEIALYLYE